MTKGEWGRKGLRGLGLGEGRREEVQCLGESLVGRTVYKRSLKSLYPQLNLYLLVHLF